MQIFDPKLLNITTNNHIQFGQKNLFNITKKYSNLA